MRVKENSDYDVLLNPNDITALVTGKPVWISLQGYEDITITLKKE